MELVPVKRHLASGRGRQGGGRGPFQFSEPQTKVRFQQTHNQGLHQLFWTLSWELHPKRATPSGVQYHISVVPEAMHEASRGPLKGAVSAKEALQGSETEMRELLGGMEENSVSPVEGSSICLLGKSMIFHKKETEKN